MSCRSEYEDHKAIDAWRAALARVEKRIQAAMEEGEKMTTVSVTVDELKEGVDPEKATLADVMVSRDTIEALEKVSGIEVVLILASGEERVLMEAREPPPKVEKAPTITIVRATKVYHPSIGDIEVYGLEPWLRKYDKQRAEDAPGIFLLDYTRTSHGWAALKKLGIDAEEMRRNSQYECPLTDRDYWAAMPRRIYTDDIRRYVHAVPSWMEKMAQDMSWVRDIAMRDIGENPKPDRVETCMLGPGYTDFILPCDGHSSIVENMVELSNGDQLVVAHHEWYNK